MGCRVGPAACRRRVCTAPTLSLPPSAAAGYSRGCRAHAHTAHPARLHGAGERAALHAERLGHHCKGAHALVGRAVLEGARHLPLRSNRVWAGQMGSSSTLAAGVLRQCSLPGLQAAARPRRAVTRSGPGRLWRSFTHPPTHLQQAAQVWVCSIPARRLQRLGRGEQQHADAAPPVAHQHCAGAGGAAAGAGGDKRCHPAAARALPAPRSSCLPIH